jgi:hypothetical protein
LHRYAARSQLRGQSPAHAEIAMVVYHPAKNRPTGFMPVTRHGVASLVILCSTS